MCHIAAQADIFLWKCRKARGIGTLKKSLIILMVMLAVGFMPAASGSTVASAKTTQQQIQEAQQEQKELQEGLDKTNENLDNLKGQQSTLKGELNNLNVQLSEVSDNLDDLEKQIAAKEIEISDTQAELDKAREKEAWQYECMVIRVRDMYERNDKGYVNTILSMESFSDMLNMADFFEKIAAYDQRKMQEFKETRILIEEHEAKLQTEKIELDNLKVTAEAEKSKVSGLISQTSNSIAKYQDDIEEAEKEALAYEAKLKEKEEDLEYLRKKLAEEMALSQQAANGVWRDISEVTFAESDRYLLANLIYCEAGGETYEGQVAVGSVVINRVLSSTFPDTVVGVIYQSKQFSPVASGRLDLALASNKATASCYRAADEAMSGVTNVGSCVFFRTPIEGLSGINIGGHVFY